MSGQVIFIDDEAAIRQAVQQWLELSGFQVRTFSRAREALTALDRDFPGVLISDVRMPDLTASACSNSWWRWTPTCR